MRINYVGISGGKDSTATLLWCLENYEQASIRACFCDTGNEAKETYDYIESLSQQVHPIITLKPALDFYQLAKKKKRFPSARARFCTQALKMEPTRLDVLELMQQGHEVVMHTGVRRGESEARRSLAREGFDEYYGTAVIRPLIDWNTKQVFAYLASKGVPHNPLYDEGADRVGCFPCIFSRKHEIAFIAQIHPERIDFLAAKEQELGHTFFAPGKLPQRFHSLTITSKDGRSVSVPTIRDVERWAMEPVKLAEMQMSMFDSDEDQTLCSSTSGLCE